MPPRKRKSDTDNSIPSRKGNKKKKPENGKGDAADNEESEPEEDNNGDVQIVNQGSTVSGELLFAGGTNWDLIGHKTLPKGVKNKGGPNLWGPHRLASMTGIPVRTVVANCNGCHSVVITTEGKAYSWGRNDKGQLGQGDIERKDVPTLIETLSDLNVVAGSCGRGHTLLLTDTGKVFAFGDNKMGQLGLGNQSPYVPSPTKIRHKGPPVRKVACGHEFSMIADIRGNLFSFGLPEYGQLGHNTDGKYFVTSNKLAFTCETTPRRVQVFIEKQRDGHVLPVTDVYVEDVACGTNHTIVLDAKKRIFTWGFGGYGRLGHAEPKDELVPRFVKFFEGPNRGAKSVYAGSTYTMAVNETGALYFWGQNKYTGEATMYPKAIQDLYGWNVRSIGTSYKSIVVAADDSLISWGPSPTYGELCYGEHKPKSSTTPQEAKAINGVRVESVACGYGHTLLIAKNDTEEDKEKLEKLPVFKP